MHSLLVGDVLEMKLNTEITKIEPDEQMETDDVVIIDKSVRS